MTSMDSCSATKDMIVIDIQTFIKRTFTCWKCAMDMADIRSSKALGLRILALFFIVYLCSTNLLLQEDVESLY